MAAGWRLGRSETLGGYLIFSPFSSSIDQFGEEGGSSDVKLKQLGCVRVQLSEERRKQVIKRNKVLDGQSKADQSGASG